MTLSVERSSVCAGDDLDAPHTESVRVPAEATLAEVLQIVRDNRYLAWISGGKATWIVESDRPIAVMAQQWSEPRFLTDPAGAIASCILENSSRQLFFVYWCQVDPTLVYNCLVAGKPLPDKHGIKR